MSVQDKIAELLKVVEGIEEEAPKIREAQKTLRERVDSGLQLLPQIEHDLRAAAAVAGMEHVRYREAKE
ncbi:MAG: hypothetical protein QME66_04795 [Candidatus Eisenbacteria bacterium]|nr:hypothetical protein [Candidatus Eisenbacteria bacterium]